MGRLGWILTILGGAAAVGGAAYAMSGGTSTTPVASGTPGGIPSPSGPVGTPVPDGVMVAAAENALALLSTKSKVPGLLYTAPASAAVGSSKYADDPYLPSSLGVFQVWMNKTLGGYQSPAGQVVLLNTQGKLDMQTFAALTAAAATA